MTEGLKDSPVPWIRIRDLDPESKFAIRKNAGSRSVSRSALNQCESATLKVRRIAPMNIFLSLIEVTDIFLLIL